MRITSENMTKSKSERASLLFMFVMLLQFFLINSDFTTILPLAYFQDLSDGLSDGIYLEGREKISGLVFVLYVYTPAVGYYCYYYCSFIRFVSLGLEFGLGFGLGFSEHWCLLAWFGKENGNPARHTGREGGRSRRSPQSLELRGGAHI